MAIDWNDLRFLLALARAKTLAGAARALSVEHTTVSRRLTALESALGTKLFVRTPDGFSPTESATEVVRLAEQVEQSVAAIERVALNDDARAEGTVRVTTSEAFSGFVVKHLATLRASHPQITVDVLSGNASFDLTRRDADIAVRLMPTEEPDLLVRRVASCGWGLYAAEAYLSARGAPKSATDLRGHDVIAYAESMSRVPGAQWLAAHGDGTKIVLRANSIIAALNAAIAGLGVAAVPCFLGTPEPTLRRIGAEIIGTRDAFLVVHPDIAKIARVRVVLDFLRECFNDNEELLTGAAKRTRTSRRAPP